MSTTPAPVGAPPEPPAPAAGPPEGADHAAVLEWFRRSVDLRLDAEGRWFHDGEPFEHPRLIALFDHGLDTHPETGEAILHVGDKWCYVRADDRPFVVRRFDLSEGALWATLNNGERLAVTANARFVVGPGERVVVQLDAGRHRLARLGRSAWHRLAQWIEAAAEGSAEDAWVVCGAGRWPLVAAGDEPPN